MYIQASLSYLDLPPPSRESEVKVRQKRFSDFFLLFIEIKSRWKKFAVFSKICEKLFSIGKKSDFKFQNRGYFVKKNIPQISWNFGHNYFTERWFMIFRQKISKTFLSGQKSNFNFQKHKKIQRTKKKKKKWERHNPDFRRESEVKFPRLVLHVLCWSRVPLSRIT